MANEKPMETDEQPTTAAAAAAATDVEASKGPTVQGSLAAIVALIELCAKSKDTRLLAGRLHRQLSSIRSQLTSAVLKTFIQTYLVGAEAAGSRTFLLEQVEKDADSMEVESSSSAATPAAGASPAAAAAPAPVPTSTLAEVEMFAFLLLLTHTVDLKRFEQAKVVADQAVLRLGAFNCRTVDTIAARIFYFYSLSYESLGRMGDVRSTLLSSHHTATLRHDSAGQEMLMNLLLRNYLHYNLYDQAEKFRSKAQRTEVFRSNQQYCRYLYYVGRIRTVQLQYTDAKDSLQQAVRKAPASALGFRVAASKWLILVRLLLGEIPERQEFAAPGLGSALQPYLDLTMAVRTGDIVTFGEAAKLHAAVFRADRTHNLITRLHHNVIRAGLRRINTAYSRISLQDIATKLHLASAADAECIVAKAIRDGGIDAVIDHEGGFMSSKEVADVYSTGEPQAAFHARIAFCLDLHNEAIKSMRYEPDAHKKMQAASSRKERMSPEEQAKAIAEEEEDDDGF